MAWASIVVGGATAAYGVIAAEENKRAADAAASKAETERNRQQRELDKQKAEYKSMKFENVYENMENVYEDLTVNQQQAQFQAQQGAQQRADIMQNLRGAAGTSGIAGLAQTLANQGQLQTQQISASIGQQETANQRARARGAANVQAQQLGGEQWVQQQQIDRRGTLLGMQMGEASGANVAYQQAQANQMNAQIAQQQAWIDLGGTVADSIGQVQSQATTAATGV